MCLQPIKLYTNSRTVHAGSRCLLTVPCGHCYQCKSRSADTWAFRGFFECQRTFDKHGYVLFDTLTYDNQHLPWFHDFFDNEITYYDHPCFSRDNVRTFIDRLRSNLRRLGYDINDNLRYILTSEYGTDPRFHHRPHHHILFFVTCKIPPVFLSRAISSAWYYGRTDGVKYKGKYYLCQKRVFRRFNSLREFNIVMYIMKYMSKDSLYYDKVFRKFRNYYKIWCGCDDFLNNRYYRDDFNKKKRDVLNFHRQSLHFGEYYLETLDLESLSPLVSLPTYGKPNFIRQIPLPSYYSRKLFYDVKKEDGVLVWRLNDYGRFFKLKFLNDSINNLCNRFKTVLMNLAKFVNEYIEINRIFKDVDLKKLAVYSLFDRGTLKTSAFGSPRQKLMNILDDNLPVEFYSYHNRSDVAFYHRTFFETVFLGNSKLGYSRHYIPIHNDEFSQKYLYYNEDYERLLYILYTVQMFIDARKKADYYKRQKEYEEAKFLGLVPSGV